MEKFLIFLLFLIIFLFPIKPLTIEASPLSVQQSKPINVTWVDADPTSSNDLIAFWQIGKDAPPASNFIKFSWQYTYGGQSKLPTASDQHPQATGTIALTAPNSPGTYTVYYCLGGEFVNCPASTTITVTSTEKLEVKCTRSECGKKTMSNIEHIIFIVTENHSFDSLYGGYCKAPDLSNPTCNDGPECCEAAPADLGGLKPFQLNNLQNTIYDPVHTQQAEVCKQNNGRMDSFITGCAGVSSPLTFAVADEKTAYEYFYLAKNYALADRFFQSSAGASSQNDMYLMSGEFLFLDNEVSPQNRGLIGARCYFLSPNNVYLSYENPTILDLLDTCNVAWKIYAEGYAQNPGPTDCYPFFYDASDLPSSYFPSLTKNRDENWQDLDEFYRDVRFRRLPAYSYIKGLGINSEHPQTVLSYGEKLTESVVKAIMSSSHYKKNTLIALLPDESGGYFDHIPPPGVSEIDGQPYGPRIPLVLIGGAVKKNYVSHVKMEPTSLLKFIEWNWFNGETGQLGTRDQIVANIGDMLDPKIAGDVPIF